MAAVLAKRSGIRALATTEHHKLVWIETTRAHLLPEAEGVVVCHGHSRRLVELSVAHEHAEIRGASAHSHVLIVCCTTGSVSARHRRRLVGSGAVQELAVVHLVGRVLARRLLVEVVVRLRLLANEGQHIVVVHEAPDVARVLGEVASRPGTVAVVVQGNARAAER